jgi:hypothetical protein
VETFEQALRKIAAESRGPSVWAALV